MVNKEDYITATEAGAILGISRKTIQRMGDRGVIYRRSHGKARYLMSDVARLALEEAKALARRQSAIRA